MSAWCNWSYLDCNWRPLGIPPCLSIPDECQFTSQKHYDKTNLEDCACMYLWCWRKNRTRCVSTIIGCWFSETESGASSGCHRTSGSISGGSSLLGTSSVTSDCERSGGNKLSTGENGCLAEHHGIKRLRAERRRRSSSLLPAGVRGHGDLKGLRITTAALDTDSTLGSNGALLTCTSPLQPKPTKPFNTKTPQKCNHLQFQTRKKRKEKKRKERTASYFSSTSAEQLHSQL
jgi:hypothetical protein